MRGLFEISCVIVGAAMLAGGLWLLLVFAQYDTTYLMAGGALLLIGLVACVSVRVGRTRGAAAFVSLALVATTGAWAYARFAVSGGAVQADSPGEAPEQPRKPEPKAPKEHPLDRALRLADESIQTLEGIADYTCTFDKEEWARGKLGAFHQVKETARMKLRHEPFSAYLKFDLPESKVGTEAIYPVEQGKMIAHSTEFPANLLGSITMKPDDWRAMIDNRYPITTIGMKNLLNKIKDMAARHDAQLRACKIQLLEDEKIDGRPCICLDVSNPKPSEDFLLYRLRIFLDKQWNVPVCVEAWDFPHDGQEKPFLVERYVYRDIKFDQKLTDEDFDPKNKKYQFQ